MILKTADWDPTADGGDGAHNAVAQEKAFYRYKIHHKINNPAQVTCYLADPDGSIFQKYDVDSGNNSVWVGCGAIEIEDPDTTNIMYARIKKVRHVESAGITVLLCKDWMDQLADKHIDFDCRMDLDSDDDMSEQGIRESFAHGSLTDADTDYRQPAHRVAGNDASYLIDSNRSWNADEFKLLHWLVFQHKPGTQDIVVGPYNHSGAENMTANGWKNLWKDVAGTDTIEDTTANLDVEYDFWILATEGSLYNSMSDMKITVTLTGEDASIDGEVSVYLTVAAADTLLGTIPADDNEYTREYRIPPTWFADAVDANGELQISIKATEQAGQDPEVVMEELYVTMTVDMDADPNAYQILDTIADPDDAGATHNTLKIDDDTGDDGQDLSITGLGIWEGCKYCICQAVHYYVDDLVNAQDSMVDLSVSSHTTHTTLITRNYKERTTLEILQDLAKADKAHFYVSMGGKAFLWDHVWNAAGTAMTDDNVIEWIDTEWDGEAMFNEVHIQGARSGDDQLYTDTGDTAYFATDPAATSKALYDHTRSKVLSAKGGVSQYTLDTIAENIVTQTDDIELFLRAKLEGLDSTYRLDTEVKVTSSLLGLTNAMYIVTEWFYDSDTHITIISMTPRDAPTSVIEHYLGMEVFDSAVQRADEASRDIEFGDVIGDTF